MRFIQSSKFRVPSALLLAMFVGFILMLNLRGDFGNPTIQELNTYVWKEDGPLELSPERGRLALLYSLVENKSFQFSLDVARFATPDLGYIHGNYVSLFAPGLSFITIPGYVLGKYLGVSQLGTFTVIALFGLLNVMFIVSISKRLGASNTSATISALAYIFATPAFAYSVTLYQHQVSTFVILFCIYSLIRWRDYKALLIVWPLFVSSISLDYPNFFMLLPIVIYSITILFRNSYKENNLKITFNYSYLLCGFSVVIPLMFFFWTNKMSYNNPFQLAGGVQAVKRIDDAGLPVNVSIAKTQVDVEANYLEFNGSNSVLGSFRTRNLLNGLYIHFLSPDRGIIRYTPVMLLGFLGIILLYKYKFELYAVLIGVIGMNVILYSMWGDPWGGWAFGSRYLIPSYALLSIFTAVLLTRYRSPIITGLFFVLFSYSAFVSTAGALTTSTIPPKVEVLALEAISGKQERYSFDRNFELLSKNNSKTVFFRSFGYRYINAWTYFYIIYSLVMSPVVILSLYSIYLQIRSIYGNQRE